MQKNCNTGRRAALPCGDTHKVFAATNFKSTVPKSINDFIPVKLNVNELSNLLDPVP